MEAKIYQSTSQNLHELTLTFNMNLQATDNYQLLVNSSFIIHHSSFRNLLFSFLIIPLSIFTPFSTSTFAQKIIIINGQSSVCQGDSATLTANDGYSTYLWSTGSTLKNIRVGASGRYSVTVTDAQSNLLSDTMNVTVHSLPNATIMGVPYVCNGRSTAIFVEGNFRVVQWSTNESTKQISVSTPGTYAVTVTDSNSCSGSSNMIIRDGSKTYNSLPDTVKICEGDSSFLNASTPSALSYYWNTDDTTATLTVRDSGRYNVIVSTGQCVNYDTVYVLTLSPPLVNLGADTAICKGDTLKLQAELSPLYSYKWTDGSTRPTLDVVNEGIYGVEVSFGKCIAGDTIDVAIFNKTQGKILDTVICTPQYRISGKLRGAKFYKWNTGIADSVLTVSKSGTYNLLANNGKCYVSHDFDLRFKIIPIVELGKDTIICQDFGRKSLLLIGGVKAEATYQWQDNSDKNTFQVRETGIYTVKASNECGETTDALKVDIKNCYEVFVPNAFSPNGDSFNETLSVFPSENITKVNQFSIFDRWGNIVFSATNFMQTEVSKYAWDGRFNNKSLSPDVFVYFIEFVTTDGHVLMQKGDVTLMR